MLQEERQLVDKHLLAQVQKEEELEHLETENQDREELVRNTLLNLQVEIKVFC
jgi:hypothetical protein